MNKKKNSPAIVLGIFLSLAMIGSMALPLWTVDQASYSSSRGLQEKSFSFSAYTIPGSADQFNAEYTWVCGFVGFLIALVFIFMILIIVSGALVYNGKRKMRAMGTVGAILSLFIFFIFMIIGFVGASTYTGYGSSSASAGTGWGEFPLLIVAALAIPYMVLLNSSSYYDEDAEDDEEEETTTESSTDNDDSYAYDKNSNYRNTRLSDTISGSVSVYQSPSKTTNARRPVTASVATPVSDETEPNSDGKVFSNLQGAQRILDVYEDRIVLTQLQNFRAFMTQDYFKGTKEIPFASMTSIQFKEGSSMILGYIQFEVPGIATGNNFTSENSWTFESKNNEIAKKVCEYCRKRIMDIKMGPTSRRMVQTQEQSPALAPAPTKSSTSSKVEEIRQFKALLDEGIITQEEFDEEKKKILSK